MLKLGAQGAAALRLGAQEVKKAYLGDRLVFGTEEVPSPSRLPEGYIEVEYIESSGTQYVDTGVKPTATTKFTIDVEPMNTPATILDYVYLARSTYSSGATYYFLVRFGSPGVQIAPAYKSASASLVYKTLSADSSPKRMAVTVDYPNARAFVNEDPEVALTNIRIATGMPSITLISEPSTRKNDIRVRLYSCQIENDSALSRDFVPCIDPSGAVGLYDLVEGKFYANSGTGTLIAGPAV